MCIVDTPNPSQPANEEKLREFGLKFVPENLGASVDGEAPAVTYDAMAYGTGFMLAPLSPGEHTVQVHAEIPFASFKYDWVYHRPLQTEV